MIKNGKKEFFPVRLWREWALLWKLRREKYDLILNLTEGDRGPCCTDFGSRNSSGCGSWKGGFWGKQRIYTHIVKPCPTPRHTGRAESGCFASHRYCGYRTDRDLVLTIPEAARRRIEEEISGPYVVIHPVSRWRFKCWPLKNGRTHYKAA